MPDSNEVSEITIGVWCVRFCVFGVALEWVMGEWVRVFAFHFRANGWSDSGWLVGIMFLQATNNKHEREKEKKKKNKQMVFG